MSGPGLLPPPVTSPDPRQDREMGPCPVYFLTMLEAGRCGAGFWGDLSALRAFLRLRAPTRRAVLCVSSF